MVAYFRTEEMIKLNIICTSGKWHCAVIMTITFIKKEIRSSALNRIYKLSFIWNFHTSKYVTTVTVKKIFLGRHLFMYLFI